MRLILRTTLRSVCQGDNVFHFYKLNLRTRVLEILKPRIPIPYHSLEITVVQFTHNKPHLKLMQSTASHKHIKTQMFQPIYSTPGIYSRAVLQVRKLATAPHLLKYPRISMYFSDTINYISIAILTFFYFRGTLLYQELDYKLAKTG